MAERWQGDTTIPIASVPGNAAWNSACAGFEWIVVQGGVTASIRTKQLRRDVVLDPCDSPLAICEGICILMADPTEPVRSSGIGTGAGPWVLAIPVSSVAIEI